MKILSIAVAAGLLLGAAAHADDGPRSGLRGVNIDPRNPWADPAPQTLRRLGFTRLRFVYKGNRDLVLAAVQRHTAEGLFVTLVFNAESVDAGSPPSGPDWSTFSGQYADAVREAALKLSRFGASVGYELWNEENLSETYVPPDQFGLMALEAASAIRQVHPSARIVLGGAFHGPRTADYLEQARDAAPGLLDLIDAIGIHSYGDLRAAASEFQDAYGRFGKPLSITEWAQHGFSDNDYARVLRGFMAALEPQPLVAEAYYFGWSETQDPGAGYGLSHPLDEPGPDGELFQLRAPLASVFRPASWTTWARVDPDVQLLFEATWERAAKRRWENEYARDQDEPGWRGPAFDDIDDVHQWAEDYRTAAE